jgi:hypothetical protein
MRWLGDQLGPTIFRQLEQGPSSAIAAIEQATGQSYASVIANFSLALYTDSLPGLARSAVPTVNRFTSRNLRQMWARLFATSQGSDVPLAMPVQLFAVSADTSVSVLSPGAVTYFRLDTPVSSSTVTVRFAAPGGLALNAALKPQVAVFRLPAGQ